MYICICMYVCMYVYIYIYIYIYIYYGSRLRRAAGSGPNWRSGEGDGGSTLSSLTKSLDFRACRGCVLP